MRIKNLNYTGDGNDDRTVTGVGYQPDVVIVVREGAGNGTDVAVISTSAMDAGDSKGMVGATAPTTGFIKSLDADGFTVGTDGSVNANSIKYHALCLKADAADLKVDKYTGDGINDRQFTGLNFNPDGVITMKEGPTRVLFRTTGHSGDQSAPFTNTSRESNLIQALITDGFELGSDGDVNADGTVYYYVAWKDVAGFIKTKPYTGDGSDPSNLTGSGFDPDYAMHHRTTGSNKYPVSHPTSLGDSTDSSIYFTDIANSTNRIQQLITDGVELGGNEEVNANGDGYGAWHLLDGDSQASGQTVTPSPTAMVMSVNAPAIAGSGTATAITPSPTAMVMSVVAPVITLGTGDQTVTPSPVAMVMSINAPVLSGSGTATPITPAALVMVMTVISPVLNLGGGVTILLTLDTSQTEAITLDSTQTSTLVLDSSQDESITLEATP